jgi:protein-disulfide isomerase
VLVAEYVRSGQLRIVFRGIAFLGPDSTLALQTVVAAGRQGRLWDVVEALYANQGPENSGWVTEAMLAEISSRAGLDYKAVVAARSGPDVARTISRDARYARAAGVPGTPFFELGRTHGTHAPVAVRSLGPEGLRPAIDALLAR